LATRSKTGYVCAAGRIDAYVIAGHDATVDCCSVPFDELRVRDIFVWAVRAYEFEWLDVAVVHLPRHVAGFGETVCAIGQTHAVVLVDKSFVEISQGSGSDFVHGGEGTAIRDCWRRELHCSVTVTERSRLVEGILLGRQDTYLGPSQVQPSSAGGGPD
jgi:hypothetical protein